jgi:quercetin dioxygenase-like cupin family protein
LLVTGAESEGSYLVMEVLALPGGRPLPHSHRHEDQTFHLIEGEGRFRLCDDTIRMRVGDFVNVPRRTVHCFWNDAPTPARVIVTTVPAGVERFVEESLAPSPHPAEASTVEKTVAGYAAAAPRYGIDLLTDARPSDPSDPKWRADET